MVSWQACCGGLVWGKDEGVDWKLVYEGMAFDIVAIAEMSGRSSGKKISIFYIVFSNSLSTPNSTTTVSRSSIRVVFPHLRW